MTWTSKRGGCKGEEISLSFAPSETITRMSVGADFNGYHIEICYVHVYTTFQSYGPYKGCNIYSTYDLHKGLAYLSGYYGAELGGLIMNYFDQ